MKDFYRVYRQTPRSSAEAFRDATYACSIYRTHNETKSRKGHAIILAFLYLGGLALLFMGMRL